VKLNFSFFFIFIVNITPSCENYKEKRG